MTIKSITSDHTVDQAKQFKRFVEDASDRALKEVNPDKDGLQRLLGKGGEFQAYVVKGIRQFTAKAPNYDLARLILGKDFISPEEIATARNLPYTDEQLVTFGNTLPAQDILEWCCDNGMMLIAGPPKSMSLLDVRAVKTGYFHSKEGGWYADNAQKFARDDKAEPVWIAFRKEPVPFSLNKNWSEQTKLVVVPMIVPNAAEAVWCLTMYKAVRDIYLLQNLYVRTSSLDSDGDRVFVGLFDGKGLHVINYWGNFRYSYLGLASARKF